MDNPLYKQYGKLIQSAKRLLAVYTIKKERKAISEGLRESGVDDAIMCKLTKGKYDDENAKEVYASVLCFYLETIMEKKDVKKEFWIEAIMPYDYAVKIIKEVSGSISEYSTLLDMLQKYGHSLGEIKVVDNSLLYRKSGIWDIPEKNELRKGLHLLKRKEEKTQRSRKTHGSQSQHTRKEFGGAGNPLLIKRK